MAADPSPDWVSSLPWAWGYGISGGGRVFFINEEAQSTTWLHPLTGETVLTGHRQSPDLPTGWEEAYTFEGARYYINHNERKVTCKHPVTGQPSQDNCIFVVNDQPPSTMTSPETKDRTFSVTSDNSNCNPDSATNPGSPLSRSSRSSGKRHNFGKRSNSIKRNPNAPVIMRGWLYKKANSGMKLWKKRWFVLSDLCLFYYRDEKEEGVLGSILLPSFQISPVTPEDHINRTHAFRATHSNMRTYYFCTDTANERDVWMRVMRGASLVQLEPAKRMNVTKVEDATPLETNHVANHRLLIRPENNNTLKSRDMIGGKGEEKATREAEKYGFQKEGQERPLTKITSVKPQAHLSDYRSLAPHVNGPELQETDSRLRQRTFASHEDPDRVIQRTNSMLQLEQWIRAQRGKGPEEESSGVLSYQTLPRNMPSYRPQIVPRYPEGYKTLPRNLKTRPDSVCSTSGMAYGEGTEEKRRSVRDDTMWQLYEWQQRQFYNKQSTLRRHTSLTSPKTLPSIPLSPSHDSISSYRAYRSELSSPVQRGDLTIERRAKAPPTKVAFPPDRRSAPVPLSIQPLTTQGLQGKTPEELTLLLIKLRRQQAELSSIREHTLTQLLHVKQSCSQKNEILSHHLQRNLIYVDEQMKDNDPLISLVHTMIENSALRPQLFQQMSQEDCRPTAYKHRSDDVDAKLSSLCEQDKVVQALEQKLQQLHKEKYTLEQALLSASQEIEMNADSPAAVQSVVLQREELQNGLLSTCREVSRANAELERSWREYDKLEKDVTSARNQMREHLERLGEVQTESAGIQRAQMQKEIWRIQDVMEGLSKHKHERSLLETGPCDTGKIPAEEEELIPPRPPLPRSYTDPATPGDGSSPLLCYSRDPVQLPDEKPAHHVQVYQRNGSYCGPDYRLYKSEPELTTVAEVDESNGDDKTDLTMDTEIIANKGSHFPVGVVPPRTKSPPLESTTIASYVTLRKSKKPETKSERPRSAVEHLCITESPRPRMSLREQMDRMRRHQAACLKEKRKGFSIPAFMEHSRSQSPSSSRDSTVQPAQKEVDKELRNINNEKNSVGGNIGCPPAQDITKLKEEAAVVSGKDKDASVVMESPGTINKEPGDGGDENFPAPGTKDVGAEDREVQLGNTGHLPDPHGNCLQVVNSVRKHKADIGHKDEGTMETERSGILFSYDFSADTLRRQKVSEETSSLPAPSPPSQLTEGSHFMCV